VEQFLVTGQEPPKPEQTFHLPEGVDEAKPDRTKLDNALDLKRILGDLDAIKRDADANNIRMIMTTFNWFAYDGMTLDPTRHRNLYGYLNRMYWPISYANIRRACDFQNRVFKQWAADNQTPLVDVAGQMPPQPDLYDDAIHTTILGSRIRAWLIFEELLPLLKKDIESGRLPQPARLNYTEHPYITRITPSGSLRPRRNRKHTPYCLDTVHARSRRACHQNQPGGVHPLADCHSTAGVAAVRLSQLAIRCRRYLRRF
jgi:hypothetical protein